MKIYLHFCLRWLLPLLRLLSIVTHNNNDPYLFALIIHAIYLMARKENTNMQSYYLIFIDHVHEYEICNADRL